MNLDDLQKRGRAVVDAADERARQIISEAQAQRERLIATASQEGHKQGFEAGMVQGHAEGVARGIEESRAHHDEQLTQLAALWTDQLDAFERQRDSMLALARTQVIELAAAIARRVVRRMVRIDPGIVLNQLEAALSSVTESTRLVIAVHPDEAETVRGELPGLIERFARCEHAQIVTDPTLEPGSCVARTVSGGVIDASLPTQINRIIETLLPTSAPVGLDDRLGLGDDPRPDAEPDAQAGTGADDADDEDRAKEDAA